MEKNELILTGYGIASLSLFTTFFLEMIRKGIISKSESIEIIKGARELPKHHPSFPWRVDDALKFSDQILELIQQAVSSLPNKPSFEA